MAPVAVQRPALHKIIHRYSRLHPDVFRKEQEWASGDETEDDDNYSVYSDEYLTQEEYSDNEDEEQCDVASMKRYSVNLCPTEQTFKRRKL